MSALVTTLRAAGFRQVYTLGNAHDWVAFFERTESQHGVTLHSDGAHYVARRVNARQWGKSSQFRNVNELQTLIAN